MRAEVAAVNEYLDNSLYSALFAVKGTHHMVSLNPAK
jgi:hypothetical protein